jgi:hypothetical protein
MLNIRLPVKCKMHSKSYLLITKNRHQMLVFVNLRSRILMHQYIQEVSAATDEKLTALQQ